MPDVEKRRYPRRGPEQIRVNAICQVSTGAIPRRGNREMLQCTVCHHPHTSCLPCFSRRSTAAEQAAGTGLLCSPMLNTSRCCWYTEQGPGASQKIHAVKISPAPSRMHVALQYMTLAFPFPGTIYYKECALYRSACAACACSLQVWQCYAGCTVPRARFSCRHAYARVAAARQWY